MDIFSLFSLQAKAATLMLETQTVMALRILGLTGALPARQDEHVVMFTEKAPALARSFAAGNRAMMSGKRPDQIMVAAMTPLSRKVRANRKRLLK